MRNGWEESEHNEKYSQEYQHVETLARKPAQISSIPPRASAHPSAIASVRSKCPRSFSDQQRVTPISYGRQGQAQPLQDGTAPEAGERPNIVGAGLAPAFSQRRTDDILTEHIFHNVEDSVPIDEIDTCPPDVQARLRPRPKRSADEPASQVDTLPTSFVQRRQGGVYSRVETQQWGATRLPNGIGRTGQPQGFSIEHCVDNVRWWLLFPGRLEFLLWLIGAIFLVCLTSFFLLVIMAVCIR